MKKTARLLIVFALVAAVFVIAQSQIAWADFAPGLASSPAQDSPVKAHPSTGVFLGTVGGTCPDVIVRDEEHELNPWCVGSISELVLEDIDELIRAMAAKFEEDVYQEMLDAIAGITFPDDLAFPADYADLADFPPASFEGNLLSTPTLVVYSIEREDGTEEYVADVTDEGYTVDDFQICYPNPPDKNGYIAFFGISGDPVEWGDEEVLETYESTDDAGNPTLCANAHRSGMYVLVEE